MNTKIENILDCFDAERALSSGFFNEAIIENLESAVKVLNNSKNEYESDLTPFGPKALYIDGETPMLKKAEYIDGKILSSIKLLSQAQEQFRLECWTLRKKNLLELQSKKEQEKASNITMYNSSLSRVNAEEKLIKEISDKNSSMATNKYVQEISAAQSSLNTYKRQADTYHNNIEAIDTELKTIRQEIDKATAALSVISNSKAKESYEKMQSITQQNKISTNTTQVVNNNVGPRAGMIASMANTLGEANANVNQKPVVKPQTIENMENIMNRDKGSMPASAINLGNTLNK